MRYTNVQTTEIIYIRNSRNRFSASASMLYDTFSKISCPSSQHQMFAFPKIMLLSMIKYIYIFFFQSISGPNDPWVCLLVLRLVDANISWLKSSTKCKHEH